MKELPHVALEHGSLPVPILAILLLGMFGVLALAVFKLGNLKTYLNEPPFPTHAATVVAGIVAFLGVGLIAMCRMALGMEMPEGYGDFLILLGAVIGVTGAWGVGKRATSAEYVEAKAAGKPTTVVQGDMVTTTERPVPAPSRVTDRMPLAGAKPTDPAVHAAMQGIAAAQRDPRLPSPLDDERE